MLEKCKAIVLKTSKYSDNSIIVNCYTDIFGKISFILSSTRGKKAKNKIALFQTLSLLELDIYYKEKREIQRIKEAHLSTPFLTLSNDIIKSSISFFLAELVFKVLKENENNLELYTFIENSIKFLDLSTVKKQISNFHLAFMIQLSKYIGFFPLQNYSEQNNCFNLQKGLFVNCKQTTDLVLEHNLSLILVQLIKTGYNNKLSLNRKQRNDLLLKLVSYFNLHLESNIKIKSINILAEIFE